MLLRVSVLICAHNEERTIRETLIRVLNQRPRPYEIIVVNDGSTDKTREVLKQFEDNPLVLILDTPANLGKANAQRYALNYITSDLVMLVDADSELEPDFLKKLLPYFLDPKVGGATGQVVSRKHNLLTAVREIQYIIGFNVYKLGMQVMNAVLVMPGCGSIIRRELFRPESDTIAEDMDLTLTILEKGYTVIYEPGAIVYTYDPPTLRLYVRQVKRWYSGAMQCFKKHWKRLPLRIKLEILLIFLENSVFLASTLTAIALRLLSSGFFLYAILPLLLDYVGYLLACLYGIAKFKRRDLLAAVIPSMGIRFLDYIIWNTCAFREYVLGKSIKTWLRGKPD